MVQAAASIPMPNIESGVPQGAPAVERRSAALHGMTTFKSASQGEPKNRLKSDKTFAVVACHKVNILSRTMSVPKMQQALPWEITTTKKPRHGGPISATT